MPMAAPHWLGPSHQPLVKMGERGGEGGGGVVPYRQSYVDWHDQGQLKEAWIGVVPSGPGVCVCV